MRIKEQLFTSIQPVFTWARSLSFREKILIGSGIAAIIPIAIYQIAYLPTLEAFKDQTISLEKVSQDLKTVPHILDRYRRFKAKKDQIENEFRQVEIKEGEQSLLENILSGKVDSGFDITPISTTNFGGSYEQANFNVRFTTTSLASVVDILSEISTGKKRMLLTNLSLSKDSSGEKLRVELGVSSIRQAKQSA